MAPRTDGTHTHKQIERSIPGVGELCNLTHEGNLTSQSSSAPDRAQRELRRGKRGMGATGCGHKNGSEEAERRPTPREKT